MSDERRPYSTYEIYDNFDGTWTVIWETDDDDDCGLAGHIYANAQYDFNSLDKALAFTGKTRRGIGQDVTVSIDGKVYNGEPISEV